MLKRFIKSKQAGRGSRLELTILSADIRGFSRYADATDADQVIATLGSIHLALRDAVRRFGGEVVRGVGDGMTAVFGLEGGPGVRAGLDCMRAITSFFPKLLQDLEDARARALKLGMGLASGEVIVGKFETEAGRERVIIGRPANLAGRLQEMSKLPLVYVQARELMGVFENVMGICPPRLVEEADDFRTVDIPEDFAIRDFTDIKRISILSN